MGPVVAPALETIEAIVPAAIVPTTSVATRRPATVAALTVTKEPACSWVDVAATTR